MKVKKLFLLHLIFLLFVSCSNKKKDKKSLVTFAVLSHFSDTTNKSFSKENKPPPVTKLNIQDPLYKDQWYLKNTGQNSGTVGIDINVEPVWKQGYKGQGMFVGILDRPVQQTHPDLRENIESVTDYYSDVSLCHRSDPKKNRGHGTSVAGIIAARGNNIGIRGIAPSAKIYSYGVIFESESTNKETLQESLAKALNRSEHTKIAVYNGSFGESAGNNYYPRISAFDQALNSVTTSGFGGKGSSLVFSAGNNDTGYFTTANKPTTNHHAVIAVNTIRNDGIAISHRGGQQGLNMWLGAPSAGEHQKMVTTNLICDGSNGYRDDFGATSGAAPTVAGVILLLRQAYPELTWRDVKLILAESARKIINDGKAYRTTGRLYSDPTKEQKYENRKGFGLVDADAALKLAKTWTLLPAMKKKTYEQTTALTTSNTHTFDISRLTIPANTHFNFIESVVLEIEVEKSKQEMPLYGWDLILISPNKKESVFFKPANNNIFKGMSYLKTGVKKMSLLTNLFLGDNQVSGEWQLKIRQTPANRTNGAITKIKNWKLIIRGH